MMNGKDRIQFSLKKLWREEKIYDDYLATLRSYLREQAPESRKMKTEVLGGLFSRPNDKIVP
jgi:hypothetical protein